MWQSWKWLWSEGLLEASRAKAAGRDFVKSGPSVMTKEVLMLYRQICWPFSKWFEQRGHWASVLINTVFLLKGVPPTVGHQISRVPQDECPELSLDFRHSNWLMFNSIMRYVHTLQGLSFLLNAACTGRNKGGKSFSLKFFLTLRTKWTLVQGKVSPFTVFDTNLSVIQQEVFDTVI